MTTIGPLRDDDVGSGLGCAQRILEGRDHVHDDGAGVVRAAEDRAQVLLGRTARRSRTREDA